MLRLGALILPVGAEPRKQSDNDNAVSQMMDAAIHRLRNPSRISLAASTVTAFIILPRLRLTYSTGKYHLSWQI